MTRSKTTSVLLFVLTVLGLMAPHADAGAALKSKTYYFGTHPARTNVTFVSEADLETIHGVSNEMRGSIKVDANGSKASGVLRVPVAGMKTGIALRDEHVRSEHWLDAKKFPWIELRLVSATEGRQGKAWTYLADLTIKGQTKRIKGTAKISPIPDKIGVQLGKGSWVRVRTGFAVQLSDFGIKIPQKVGAKVSETWKLGIDIYGTTAVPQEPKRSTAKRR